MECRICSSGTNLIGTYERSALEVSRLYANPTTSAGVQIPLYGCPVCGHYQIPYINTEDYYDEYVMTASHSMKMQALQAGQAEMLSSLARRKTYFIEAGCGDGSFLRHARQFFENVLGIEPSKPFYDLCREKGLPAINDYLTANLTFEHLFDAFASRQVFEHIPNPLQMLSLLYAISGNGAAGLIEVPNAQKMLSGNRYFDLFSDHINYFTPLSLCHLSRKAGFEVIQVRESFNGDYLEMYLRKQAQSLSMETKRERDLSFILENSSRYGNVSAWGAGAKAQAIMTALGDRLSLQYLFDTDPHKEHRYIVNCTAEVTQPTQEKIGRNDLIIIFAVSYQDEIIGLLKNTYGYTGDVLCLEGDEPCIAGI